MGHTKPHQLEDLQDVLDSMRAWEGLKEKSRNIFYFKSKPFLHFHDTDGQRWADVREGDTWGKPLGIPFMATQKQKESFLAAVEKRYKKLKDKS